MTNSISIASLRAFAPLAAAIAPNPLLPICDYVKIEWNDAGISITKNNGNAFVVGQCSEVHGNRAAMLVDEKTLFEFVDQAETDTIALTATPTAVTLQSGTARCSSPTEPVAAYLNNDTPDGEGTPINADLAAEIATAAAFIKDEEIPTPRSLVFVGEGHVAACGGEIGYFSAAPGAPHMILRREVAKAIGALGSCTHLENASYDFFRTADVTMGFVKSDLGFSRVHTFAEGLASATRCFQMDKTALVKFNAWAIATAVGKTMTADWQFNHDMLLRWQDPTYDHSGDRVLAVQGSGSFSYLPALMNQCLKGIPGDEIVVYASKDKIYITDLARTYTALVMECAPVVMEGNKSEKREKQPA